MKTFYLILALNILLSCSSLTTNEQPGVYVLGSIHSNMLEQSKYTLQDFISALYIYKPSLIFTEVRQEYNDAIDGVIHGAPEQSIVYSCAKELGIPVIPVDWHNDTYNLKNDQRAAGEPCPPKFGYPKERRHSPGLIGRF